MKASSNLCVSSAVAMWLVRGDLLADAALV